MEAVKDTILLKDIVERHKIKDAILLDRIFAYLVNNSASLVSVTNVVNYLNNEQSKKDGKAKKQNYETVSNYISFLEDAFVILRADRYDVKGKDILKGAAKYYANDNSYHNYLYEGYATDKGLCWRTTSIRHCGVRDLRSTLARWQTERWTLCAQTTTSASMCRCHGRLKTNKRRSANTPRLKLSTIATPRFSSLWTTYPSKIEKA